MLMMNYLLITFYSILENKKGKGVLMHKAKAPVKPPVGDLIPRKKAPKYSMNPIKQYGFKKANTNADLLNDVFGMKGKTSQGPKMNKQDDPDIKDLIVDEDKDSQEIKDFCYTKRSAGGQSVGSKKIRAFHQNDWDPKIHGQCTIQVFPKH